mmetsp:Transcript_66804/g.192991  ORF Transcript_66804/g.192991 Transcript_66804/m.192991 type:complete len:257 (+) Transcript_66804:421-1191(+)
MEVLRPSLAAHPALRPASCRRELLQDHRDPRRIGDAPLDPRSRPNRRRETPRSNGALRRPLPTWRRARNRLGVAPTTGGVPARGQVRAVLVLLGGLGAQLVRALLLLALLEGVLSLERLLSQIGRLRQRRRLAPGRLRWNSAQSARRCNGAVRMQHVFGDIFRVGEVKVPRPCLAAHPALCPAPRWRELLQDQRDLRRIGDTPLSPGRRPNCGGHETPRRPLASGPLRRAHETRKRIMIRDLICVMLSAGRVHARR